MQKIVYYVACSLDGFIAGKNDDVSQFMHGGEGVDKYRADLKQFGTVIMGRKTYEFGYQYGLEPGQPAYPNMEHHIFSNSMQLDELANTVHIEPIAAERIKEIKTQAKTPIYLCGGGEFAGWLLDNDLVDELKLKLNPVVLGEGVPLFGQSVTKARWKMVGTEIFDDGLQILTYKKEG